MKAYTDLEQSKKLAEILPLESADYHYIAQGEKSYFYPYSLSNDVVEQYNGDIKYIPCWSLAALLDILPKIVNTQTLFIETSAALWHIGYRDVYITRSENLVDACVDMIIKLKELKML